MALPGKQWLFGDSLASISCTVFLQRSKALCTYAKEQFRTNKCHRGHATATAFQRGFSARIVPSTSGLLYPAALALVLLFFFFLLLSHKIARRLEKRRADRPWRPGLGSSGCTRAATKPDWERRGKSVVPGGLL